MKFSDYAKQFGNVREACIAAYEGGKYKINKYAELEEGALEDIHHAYAEEVARDDIGLLWLEKREAC